MVECELVLVLELLEHLTRLQGGLAGEAERVLQHRNLSDWSRVPIISYALDKQRINNRSQISAKPQLYLTVKLLPRLGALAGRPVRQRGGQEELGQLGAGRVPAAGCGAAEDGAGEPGAPARAGSPHLLARRLLRV